MIDLFGRKFVPLQRLRYRKGCILGLALAAAASTLAVTGCSEHSYPSPATEQAPPPPPAPPPPLLGAPYPQPCAPTAGPCGVTPGAMQPPIISNAPIPNPPETGVHGHGRRWAYEQSGRIHVHAYNDGAWHVVGPAPTPHKAASKLAPVGAAPASSAAKAPSHSTNTPSATPAAVKPAANVSPTPPLGNTTGPEGDKFTVLQTELSNLVGLEAELDTPPHFATNQTVDVSLTLPSQFAEQLHEEAVKAGVADATTSVNIEAHLSGTGYTLAPGQPQSQPLLLGQQTIFRWKATPTAQASGPLKADMTADLLTISKSIPIGTVKSQASSGQISGRLIGVGLLVLLLLIVAGWLLRRKRAPAIRRRDI